MLIALLPVAVVAILGCQREKWLRNYGIGVFLIGILFSILIMQRGMATNRYALSTNHLGASVLGAYPPGAGAGVGWIRPILLTIVFKVGLHAVIVSRPSYFLAVVALELLVIAIVWDVMLKKEYRKGAPLDISWHREYLFTNGRYECCEELR